MERRAVLKLYLKQLVKKVLLIMEIVNKVLGCRKEVPIIVLEVNSLIELLLKLLPELPIDFNKSLMKKLTKPRR